MVIVNCSIIKGYYVKVISPTGKYVCQNSPEEGLAGQSAHSLFRVRKRQLAPDAAWSSVGLGLSPAGEIIFGAPCTDSPLKGSGTIGIRIGIGIAIAAAIVFRTRVLPNSIPIAIPTRRFEQSVVIFGPAPDPAGRVPMTHENLGQGCRG